MMAAWSRPGIQKDWNATVNTLQRGTGKPEKIQ
jgi:hypothetical protein